MCLQKPLKRFNFSEKTPMDAILALRLLAELHRYFNRQLHVAYIDIKSAFDSVDRIALLKALRGSGMPPFLIQLIRDLHTETALCLLDLTAAFDTVDHDLLLPWSGSSVYVVSHCSGSGLTWAADLIVFGLPAPPQGPCTSSALFPRVQSSARDCLSCTLRTWLTRL